MIFNVKKISKKCRNSAINHKKKCTSNVWRVTNGMIIFFTINPIYRKFLRHAMDRLFNDGKIMSKMNVKATRLEQFMKAKWRLICVNVIQFIKYNYDEVNKPLLLNEKNCLCFFLY